LKALTSWNSIKVVNAMVRARASSAALGAVPSTNSVNSPPGS
jgi:hypothetical protein